MPRFAAALCLVLVSATSTFALSVPRHPRILSQEASSILNRMGEVMDKQLRTGTATAVALMLLATPVIAEDGGGASLGANSKIRNGGASTIVNQRGARKTITRGVQMDGSDFSSEDLTGVSFQQSQIRKGNWKDAKLLGASFFDATLDDGNFEGAQMSQVNLEMASLVNCNLKNAVITEAYVTGATSFTDAIIDGADFTDTYLRKDQKKYLCERASGINSVTGVDTKDSLMCP